MVNVHVPRVLGVPDSRAVPDPAVKDMPGGSVPLREIVGSGQPVAVIVNELDCPLVSVAVEGLVIFGPSRTLSVKFCVDAPTVLVALNTNGYCPPVPAAGVPDRSAVPLVFGVKLTPLGSVPVIDTVARGKASLLTVKLPAVPTVKLVDSFE
jgi:hypothetical protein